MNEIEKEDLPELVSLKRLAAQWEVSPTTARRVLREGGVRPVFLSEKPGGTIRFCVAEVQDFIDDATGSPHP
ncbi:MAG: hypothetical protein ACOC0A_00200 [Planctomycetota bacterium]